MKYRARLSRQLLFFALAILLQPSLSAYPLDGAEYSGIKRLEGYRLAQEGKARARRLHPGAKLSTEQADLRLQHLPEMQIPEVDNAFNREVRRLLNPHRSRYSVAILDLTDPNTPFYAEHNAKKQFNPGSVGKIAVAIGIFHELAKAFPDPDDRLHILRTTQITADGFIYSDSHKVPFWNNAKNRMTHRRLRVGDNGSLAEYLDWMMSASSNAAAAMVQKQLLLLRQFGAAYPVSQKQADTWLRNTKPRELAALFRETIDQALQKQGINTELFRQGGFFTRAGKKRVPAGGSRGNARELLKLLLRLEQGLIIDEFSSREIKRYLYMTQKRIRYASSPALKHEAVYFKSGSLYRCREEPGFVCRKYRGNVTNLLNSIAIVESTPNAEKKLHYLVVVNSNILRKNAAVEHQSLATRIHRLIQKRHGLR